MKIYDIKPDWLRRLLLIGVFSWITFVLIIVMTFVAAIALIIFEGYNFIMWWAVDYVRQVWNGEEEPDVYKPLDFG